MWRSALPSVVALALAPAIAGAQPLPSASDPPQIRPGGAAASESPALTIAAVADCAGGAIKDDGDPETGYGFVPSARYGVYVQELRAAELPRRQLAQVCVCLLKTRGESDAELEVVFYEDAGGRPAEEPYAAVAARATDLPRTKETAGTFYGVDVSGVTLAPGTSWVGARWDPSAQSFLFVCTDTSAATAKTPVFFREDRARGWASVFHARDPIFKPHRAILVRVLAAEAP